MLTYKDIPYHLIRRRRKTVSIYIERDGSVSVRAPEDFALQQVEEILERKRYWIYKNLEEWRLLNTTKVEREFVNGESFLYLGRTYRLQWVDEQTEPLLLKGGYFCLRRDSKTAAEPMEAFKAFYRERGQVKLLERTARYAPQLNVQVTAVRVMELKHRWASCNIRKGTLNFHWRAMMAPLKILDYIVVHELAHLLVANHSEAFWNQVDKILPDYRERQDWLRLHGAGMAL